MRTVKYKTFKHEDLGKKKPHSCIYSKNRNI